MADLLSYGAYLPRYRTPLGEVTKFFGVPGRPRAKTLATPALDEDPLTMAFEAAREALGGRTDPQAIISLCLSAPFGLRKMSATLARALDLRDDIVPYDISGHPGSLLDAFAVAAGLAKGKRPVLVVVSDHQVSYEQRVADTLSAGAAAAFLVGAKDGFATLGPQARVSNEVYDVWTLGREPEARYRLEVLSDAYAKASAAIGALEKATEVATSSYVAVCPSQPHPAPLRSLGKAGVSAEQVEATSFVGEIGNLGCASVGLALTLGLDTAKSGDRVLAFGYGAGEGIAQSLELKADPPAIGAADRIAGEPIPLGTYYRWTRGRQAEPH